MPTDEPGPIPTVPHQHVPSQAVGLPQTHLSVTKLAVPLPIMITFLAVVLGGVVSMTLVWGNTVRHAEDEHVHVDAAKTRDGGGVAYQRDIDRLERKFEQRMLTEYRKVRKMLKEMSITCSQRRNRDLHCVVNLPEPD